MSKYSVNVKNAKGNATEMKDVGESIKSISQSVASISNRLKIGSASSFMIKKYLQELHEQILEESVKMDSLSEALLRMMELYEKTENRICNFDSGSDKIVFDNEQDSNGFKEWWNNFIKDFRDWRVLNGFQDPEEQERRPGEAVTENQEKEQDLYMQHEIEQINKEDRFSKKTWKKASVEERIEILNEYVRRIAEIMGLDITQINLFNTEAQNGYVTKGGYSDSDGEIYINRWILESGDGNGFPSYTILSTVVHELRHAYQDNVIKNPERYVVTEETAEKWKESFDDYKTKDEFVEDGMSEEEAYNAYRDQEVERDARDFAKQN